MPEGTMVANSRQAGSVSASQEDNSTTAVDRRLGPYSNLAPVLAILSCVLYSCNGELLQFLQLHSPNGGNASPLLNLIFCHLGGLVFAPKFLSYKPASLNGNTKLGALLLSLLLMGYNYCWLLSARFLAAGLTNALFQTSVAFIYLAGVAIFNDKMESMQLFGVTLAICGAFLASGISSNAPQNLQLGIFLALCASIGMMLYQVLFKYLYGHLKSDAHFLAHIGAWVSVWHILVIFPLAVLAHIAGFEHMQLPHGNLAVGGTVLSACIASTVNAMYICMVMWGSFMLLPCAQAVSVPFTVGLDMFLHHVIPGRSEIMGHLMILTSVVLIMGLHKDLARHWKPKTVYGESVMA